MVSNLVAEATGIPLCHEEGRLIGASASRNRRRIQGNRKISNSLDPSTQIADSCLCKQQIRLHKPSVTNSGAARSDVRLLDDPLQDLKPRHNEIPVLKIKG